MRAPRRRHSSMLAVRRYRRSGWRLIPQVSELPPRPLRPAPDRDPAIIAGHGACERLTVALVVRGSLVQRVGRSGSQPPSSQPAVEAEVLDARRGNVVGHTELKYATKPLHTWPGPPYSLLAVRPTPQEEHRQGGQHLPLLDSAWD